MFSTQERDILGEFFHYTTPIAPNYLKYLYLDGDGEILLLFIETLRYTLSVVTEEIYITNFVIDESTFCRLLESLYLVKRLAIINWKLLLHNVFEFEDRLEYKLQDIDFYGSCGNDDKVFKIVAQSLSTSNLINTIKKVNVNEDEYSSEEVKKIFSSWGFEGIQVFGCRSKPNPLN